MKKEYSKVLLNRITVMYILVLIVACVFSWCDKDTSVFEWTIPSISTVFSFGVSFYYNKAKTENLIKLKKENSEIENNLDGVIDDTLSDCINENIE